MKTDKQKFSFKTQTLNPTFFTAVSQSWPIHHIFLFRPSSHYPLKTLKVEYLDACHFTFGRANGLNTTTQWDVKCRIRLRQMKQLKWYGCEFDEYICWVNKDHKSLTGINISNPEKKMAGDLVMEQVPTLSFHVAQHMGMLFGVNHPSSF